MDTIFRGFFQKVRVVASNNTWGMAYFPYGTMWERAVAQVQPGHTLSMHKIPDILSASPVIGFQAAGLGNTSASSSHWEFTALS